MIDGKLLFYVFFFYVVAGISVASVIAWSIYKLTGPYGVCL